LVFCPQKSSQESETGEWFLRLWGLAHFLFGRLDGAIQMNAPRSLLVRVYSAKCPSLDLQPQNFGHRIPESSLRILITRTSRWRKLRREGPTTTRSRSSSRCSRRPETQLLTVAGWYFSASKVVRNRGFFMKLGDCADQWRYSWQDIPYHTIHVRFVRQYIPGDHWHRFPFKSKCIALQKASKMPIASPGA
jgi:hypothetical protein